MNEDNKVVPWKQELTDDAFLVRQTGSLQFYFSKSENIFIVGVSGCQTAETPVRLARHEIVDLLNVFDQHTREKEAELLAELESGEDDF